MANSLGVSKHKSEETSTAEEKLDFDDVTLKGKKIKTTFTTTTRILQRLERLSFTKGHVPANITKLCLSYFHVSSTNTTKCHQMHNLIGSKDSTEQNRSSSLVIKCRIARIEVDYSSSNLISL